MLLHEHDDGGDAAAPQPAPLPTSTTNCGGGNRRGVSGGGPPSTPPAAAGKSHSPNTLSPARPNTTQTPLQAAAPTQHQLAVRFKGVVSDIVALALANRDESMCDQFTALADEAVKAFRGAKADIRVQHRSPGFHRTNTNKPPASSSSSSHPHPASQQQHGHHAHPQHHVDPHHDAATAVDDEASSAAVESGTSTPPRRDSPKRRSYAAALGASKSTTATDGQRSPQKSSPAAADGAAAVAGAESDSDSDEDANNRSLNAKDAAAAAAAARGEERRAEAEERRKNLAAERHRKFEEQAERTAMVKVRREQKEEQVRTETREKAQRNERARAEATHRKKEHTTHPHPHGEGAVAPAGGPPPAYSSAVAASFSHPPPSAVGGDDVPAAAAEEEEHKQQEPTTTAAADTAPAAEVAPHPQPKQQKDDEQQSPAPASKDKKGSKDKNNSSNNNAAAATAATPAPAVDKASSPAAAAHTTNSNNNKHDDFTTRMANLLSRHGKTFLGNYAMEHGVIAASGNICGAGAAAASAAGGMTTTNTKGKKKGGGNKDKDKDNNHQQQQQPAAAAQQQDSGVSAAALAHGITSKCRFNAVLDKFRGAAAASNPVSAGGSGVILTRTTANEFARALAATPANDRIDELDHAALRLNQPSVFEVLSNSIAEAARVANSSSSESSSSDNSFLARAPFDILHRLLQHPREGAKHKTFFCRSGLFQPVFPIVYNEFMRTNGQLTPTPMLRDALSLSQLCCLFFFAEETPSSSSNAIRSVVGEFLRSLEPERALPHLNRQLAAAAAVAVSASSTPTAAGDAATVGAASAEESAKSQQQHKNMSQVLLILECMQYVLLLCNLRVRMTNTTTQDEMTRHLQMLLGVAAVVLRLSPSSGLSFSSGSLSASPNNSNNSFGSRGQALSSPTATGAPQSVASAGAASDFKKLPNIATLVLFTVFRLLNEVIRKNLSMSHRILAELTMRQLTYQVLSAFCQYVKAQSAFFESLAAASDDEKKAAAAAAGAIGVEELTAVSSIDGMEQMPVEVSAAEIKSTAFDPGALSPTFLDSVDFGLTFMCPQRPSHTSDSNNSATASASNNSSAEPRTRAALHEVLLFAGYICLNNPAMQDVFHYNKDAGAGATVTSAAAAAAAASASSASSSSSSLLLQLLDACPISYMGVAKHILLPSLVCICFRNRRNLSMLEQEMSLDTIVDFLNDEITARPSVAKKRKNKDFTAPQITPRPRPESWADMLDDDSDDDTMSASSSATPAGTPANSNVSTGTTPHSNSNTNATPNSSNGGGGGPTEDFKKVAQRKEKLTQSIAATNNRYALVHHFRLDKRFPMSLWNDALAEMKQQMNSPTMM